MATSLKTPKSAIARAIALALLPTALIVGCANNDKMVKIDDTTQISSEAVSADSHDMKANWEETIMETAEQEPAVTEEDTVADNSEIEAMPAPGNVELDTGVELAALTEETETLALTDESGAELMDVNFSEPEPAKLESPEKSIFQFASNQFDIAEADMEDLKKHVQFLKENPGMELSINGYSDARGSAEYNFKLSKKRADQIHAILVTLGAPEIQLKVNSYGEGFPLNDEKNWDENRRVELKYGQRDESIMASF